MVRDVIVATVVGSGIVDASMVVIILFSGIKMVVVISVIARRVILRSITESDSETLGRRFVWCHGHEPQYHNRKDKKAFHRVCSVFNRFKWNSRLPISGL